MQRVVFPLRRCILVRSYCQHVDHYNDQIRKAHSLDAQFQLMDMMEKENLQPTVTTYNTLLRSCMNKKELCKGILIYEEEMKRNRVQPDLKTFEHLFVGFGNLSTRLEKLFSYYEDLLSLDIEPSIKIYNQLISAAVQGGDDEQVCFILREMDLYGVTVDQPTYNILIDGCAKHKKWERVAVLLQSMEQEGFSPDVFTFTSLIRENTRQKRFKEAIDAYDRMKKKKIEPTIVTMISLIETFLAQNELENALVLFQEATSCFPPDRYLYNIMINGLIEDKRAKEACALFRSMKGDNFQPSTSLYHSLLKMLCTMKKIELIQEIQEGEEMKVPPTLLRDFPSLFSASR